VRLLFRQTVPAGLVQPRSKFSSHLSLSQILMGTSKHVHLWCNFSSLCFPQEKKKAAKEKSHRIDEEPSSSGNPPVKFRKRMVYIKQLLMAMRPQHGGNTFPTLCTHQSSPTSQPLRFWMSSCKSQTLPYRDSSIPCAALGDLCGGECPF
jgi:hypothetical protein